MKIGILTYHSPYNFGANLQAFTASKILEAKRCEVKVIDFQRLETRSKYRTMVPQQQWTGHDDFIIHRLPLTRHASTKQELIGVVKEECFDGIVVGADAVWSFSKQKTDVPAYFMDWLFDCPEIANIPVASMSVANMSGGFKHITPENKLKLKGCIAKFSILTVRDKWTQKVINSDIFDGEPKVQIINPDPVFCIDKYITDAWESRNLFEKGRKYILVSFAKNTTQRYNLWLQKLKDLAHNNGYLVGELPIPEGISGSDLDFTVPYPIDPIQWYLWLKNASGYIGLRFHAVVSCFAGGTPFFSIDTYGNSTLPIRLFNRLGFYRLGRKFDNKSKICQLLSQTKFKSNRINISGFLSISPEIVFRKLTKTRVNDIVEEREKFAQSFQHNLNAILNFFEQYKKQV